MLDRDDTVCFQTVELDRLRAWRNLALGLHFDREGPFLGLWRDHRPGHRRADHRVALRVRPRLLQE